MCSANWQMEDQGQSESRWAHPSLKRIYFNHVERELVNDAWGKRYNTGMMRYCAFWVIILVKLVYTMSCIYENYWDRYITIQPQCITIVNIFTTTLLTKYSRYVFVMGFWVLCKSSRAIRPLYHKIFMFMVQRFLLQWCRERVSKNYYIKLCMNVDKLTE